MKDSQPARSLMTTSRDEGDKIGAESGLAAKSAACDPMAKVGSGVEMTPLLTDAELSMAITKKDFDMSHNSVNVELPESIYGAAMMALIRSSQSYRRVVHGVTFCVFAGLVLNIVTQIYVLLCTKFYITAPAVLRVRDLYDSYHQEVWSGGVFSQDAWNDFGLGDELCQLPLSSPLFFLAILAIWTATCWVDLLESFRYASLWAGLPRPGEYERHRTVVEEVDDDVVLTGADLCTKAFVIATISIPKVLILVLLWWLGARWLVATTSFQDLLLNAVALAFVTELDELVYLSLIPDDIQEMVRTFKISRPPAKMQNSQEKDGETPSARASHAEIKSFVDFRDRRLAKLIGRMVMTMAVVVGWPVVYMRCLQQVLPGYRWDVHGPCESRIRQMMTGV